jgi:hypothetical protein
MKFLSKAANSKKGGKPGADPQDVPVAFCHLFNIFCRDGDLVDPFALELHRPFLRYSPSSSSLRGVFDSIGRNCLRLPHGWKIGGLKPLESKKQAEVHGLSTCFYRLNRRLFTLASASSS